MTSYHCLPVLSKGANHHHPSPSRTVSLPGSHRKLQYQLNTPTLQASGWHRPGLAQKGRNQTSKPLPGLGLRGQWARSS